MRTGLILHGAPSTGKDTVTQELSRISNRYRLFERLKSGAGRTSGYRMTNDAELDRLEEAGLIVWANRRYGARYAIDGPGLDQLVATGAIPVVHAGQPQVIGAVRSAQPHLLWIVVQLTCDLETAASRIIARGTGDVDERLAARAATPTIDADLTVDTAVIDPAEAARRIDVVISVENPAGRDG